MLNPNVFAEARDAYARTMGFTNVNGTIKPISDIKVYASLDILARLDPPSYTW
jgi:hypothetical protein